MIAGCMYVVVRYKVQMKVSVQCLMQRDEQRLDGSPEFAAECALSSCYTEQHTHHHDGSRVASSGPPVQRGCASKDVSGDGRAE